MYLWKLFGHDTAEGALCSGVAGDLAESMRAAESLLLRPAGFVAQVTEVVPRMSVFHLDSVHVPTGRQWHGRRDTHGGVHWTARHDPVDPDVAYSLAASQDLGFIAG
jgi:hypothetical protein